MLLLCALLLFECHQRHPITTPEPELLCVWNGIDTLTYLDSIACPKEFEGLAGPPLMPTLSDVRSVKVIYDIATQRLYYAATSAFELHFDFCRVVLRYPGSHGLFNDEQYGDGPQRLYYLGAINYYRGSGIYALQFFADDRISAEGIRATFFAARQSSFFGDSLRFLANSTTLQQQLPMLSDIPIVTEDRIYGGQQFQTLNAAEAYGYVRKLTVADLDTAPIGRHDIVIVNGLPISVPVIAGIITTAFQTPLSHVNVLSHNRNTPNMALKTAWTDSTLSSLIGTLVYFNVTLDTFTIREAELSEAEEFWRIHENRMPVTLLCRDDTAGLFSCQDLSYASLPLVGAKAANFAELSRIRYQSEPLPVPEGAFAIPFYYYRRHMAENGLDSLLQRMLSDTLFKADSKYRASRLSDLRQRIIDAPLDPDFTSAVEEKIRSLSTYTTIQFRSSTNVEDLAGFNGAGLYESHSADIAHAGKTIPKAIRNVFASLWTFRGFEERDYFNINQLSCAMGILVHRTFTDEQANGVAITNNIYFDWVPAYTINVQIKNISVVMPPEGFLSDQLLFHLLRDDCFDNPSIEYIAHSNVNNGQPVMTIEEITQLARWLSIINNHFSQFPPRPSPFWFAMDVEFKLDGPGRKLYIKQARPYQ